MVLVSFLEGYVLLPFGLASSLGAVLLTALRLTCCAEVVAVKIGGKPERAPELINHCLG